MIIKIQFYKKNINMDNNLENVLSSQDINYEINNEKKDNNYNQKKDENTNINKQTIIIILIIKLMIL